MEILICLLWLYKAMEIKFLKVCLQLIRKKARSILKFTQTSNPAETYHARDGAHILADW